MIVAVDNDIPYWEQAFSQFGQLRAFSGRNLKSDFIRDADALVVRAVTPVRPPLLDETSVKYVAGASAGIDHVDVQYLKARGIQYGYAAGCNADSVSEYIVTALHILASRKRWDLKRKSLAVIGIGNVGSRVVKKARALGMEVRLCAPPLRDSTGESQYQSLEEVMGADILTFHVPLSSEGLYPTRHMVDQRFLDRLSPVQFLINTSRGAVIDSDALKTALGERKISGAILDVWEGEPVIDYGLLELVDIGTPHISGVALDGKIRATEMVREQLSNFFGIRTSRVGDYAYPENIRIQPQKGTCGPEAISSVLQQGFGILDRDSQLRALAAVSREQAAAGFDRLRNERPLRLEFRHFTVDLGIDCPGLADTLRAMGFEILGG